MVSDFVTSMIRTWVPVAVGYLVAWGLLPLEQSDPVVLAMGALATGLYYSLVRVLERRWPWVGWFLGSPKQPTYGGE